MPLYYFVLKAGRHTFPDNEGQEFPDVGAAQAHAHAVARELMRNRENKTCHWRVQVCDDYLQPQHECLFADVDETLERFDPDFLGSVKAVARTTAAIDESLRQIDRSMSDLRSMIGQIDSIVSSRP